MASGPAPLPRAAKPGERDFGLALVVALILPTTPVILLTVWVLDYFPKVFLTPFCRWGNCSVEKF